ncbi:acyltransferase [Virgibacillus senegalensis]|uniref:acyltransferase n=1 Tax=Virgibacillus senegalensis TaxID=1499679 RepID=UPI00069CBEA6|nr:acyltransferase [Virgibacillus senegalensis]
MENDQIKQASPKKYFYELNFIRALACLCVVMVHVTANHYSINGQTFNWATLFLNQIARFGTPAFAIISGFLLYNQAINRGFKLQKFVSSRFTKIVLPFVIWSIIYLIVRSYNFPWMQDGASIKEFVLYFLRGDSYYHLYFMIVVVQFYILFPILQFATSKNWLIFLTLVAFFTNYFFIESPFDFGSDSLNSFFQDRASLFYWMFFFLLGGLLVHYWSSLVEWIEKNAIFCAVLGLVVTLFAIYEYKTFGFYSSTRLLNMFNLPVLFISLTGVYFILGRWKKMRNYFVQLGNLSMGIYLVHPLVIHVIRTNIPEVLDRTRWIPLSFIFTVAISIIIVKLINKLPFGQYIVTVAAAKKPAKQNTSTEKKTDTLSA